MQSTPISVNGCTTSCTQSGGLTWYVILIYQRSSFTSGFFLHNRYYTQTLNLHYPFGRYWGVLTILNQVEFVENINRKNRKLLDPASKMMSQAAILESLSLWPGISLDASKPMMKKGRKKSNGHNPLLPLFPTPLSPRDLGKLIQNYLGMNYSFNRHTLIFFSYLCACIEILVNWKIIPKYKVCSNVIIFVIEF